MDIPQGAIPVDQFQPATEAQSVEPMAADNASIPEGAIPVDQFETHESKYGGVGQQAIAGLEGLAKGVAGPAATYAERMLGVKARDIRGRAEENPWTHGGAEALGLGAGLVSGTGIGGIAGKIGETAEIASGLGKVSEAANLANMAKVAAKAGAPEAAQLAAQAAEAAQGVTYGAKVGSAAVKQAAEMAALGAGDVVSQRLVQDPQAGTESAIANVGLAAALGGVGGAFGAGVVSPLWKSTVGPKIEAGLSGLISRLGGKEGQAAVSTAAELEAATGVAIPQELKSVINDAPGAKSTHSYLNQNDVSIAGRSYQKKVSEFESNLAAKALESFGKSADDIDKIADLDKYAAGRAQGETLHDEIKKIAKPTIDGYNIFNKEAENSLINQERKQVIADQIAEASIKKGWHKAEDEGSQKLAQNIVSKLSKQETVLDLKKFITNLRDAHPFGKETYMAAKDIGRILQNNLEETVAENILRAGGSSESALQKVAAYGKLRQDYSKLMTHIDNLNEHLHVGKYYGPESFLQALKEHSAQHGERVLNQLSGKNSAAILDLLKSTPETLSLVRQHHLDNLLSEAVQKAPVGKRINTNYLVDTLFNPKKISPQVRNLIASPQAQGVIENIGKALDGLKDPNHNFSNSARVIAKQEGMGIMSPLSLIMMLMGHGAEGVLSFLGSLGMNEAKPALKLGLLKLLASDAPVKAEGFKTMVSLIDNAYESEKMLSKAAKGVFNAGTAVLTDGQMPTAKDIAKLDKLVVQHQQDPNKLIANQTGDLGHYAQDHDMAAAKASQNALNYLQSIKPQPVKSGPMDRELPVDPAVESRYNRALTIAQNPLVVLQHIKDGTLQVTDIQDFKSLYPSYANVVAEAVTNEMINNHANKEEKSDSVPYKTRVGLSLFLGQPLDSSMSPMSIISAQPKPKQAPPASQQQSKTTKHSMNSLGKSNSMYRTPSQTSEAHRAERRD